jgi:hypothetical protein
MKTYGGVDVEIQIFLTSALGERSASLPGRFTASEGAPDTYWIEGYLGPRICLDDVERKMSYPYCNPNSNPMALHPTANRYSE